MLQNGKEVARAITVGTKVLGQKAVLDLRVILAVAFCDRTGSNSHQQHELLQPSKNLESDDQGCPTISR